MKPHIQQRIKTLRMSSRMKFPRKACAWLKGCALGVLVCSLVMTCSPLLVRADDISDLENKASSLNSQLSGINQEMVKISDEITSAKNQIEIINGEILRTQDSLADAQADEAERYQAMKSRIKYMYEVGNESLLEMLFSAESMTDFLNKAEFIENISSYDRDMLDRLHTIREEIAEREQVLLDQQASLISLQDRLEQRRVELNATAKATSTDLATFNMQLAALRQEEARRAEEARKAEEAKKNEQKPGTVPTVPAVSEEVKPGEDKKPEEEKKPDEGTLEDTVVNGGPANVSAGELDIFAAILECEAMQEHDSLLAVATVIMNRMSSSLFPNTIKDIVYAEGQFEPVWTGRLDTVLSRGPSDLSYQVAQEALNGARLPSVADCYYFLYAGATNRPGVNVGNNLFFQSW